VIVIRCQGVYWGRAELRPAFAPTILLTAISSSSGLKGLTIQPLAPASRARRIIEGWPSVVSMRMGVVRPSRWTLEDHLQAGHARHVDVAQGQIDVGHGAQLLEPIQAVEGFDDVVACARQGVADLLPDRAGVVDDQDSFHPGTLRKIDGTGLRKSPRTTASPTASG
jgi:hypothetical protein